MSRNIIIILKPFHQNNSAIEYDSRLMML